MNSSSEALRRELGEVFTPPSVAASICKRLSNLNLLEGAKILEPSVGDGAFVSALNAGTTKPAHITAVDLNANSLAAIFESEGDIPLTKIADDFSNYSRQNSDRFDIIVGNPPYIRRNRISESFRAFALELCSQLDYPIIMAGNAWTVFILACCEKIRLGGSMAVVVPYELLTVDHGKRLVEYISQKFSKVEVYVGKERAFPNIEQDGVVLLASGKGNSKNPAAVEMVLCDALDTLDLDACDADRRVPLNSKPWASKYFVLPNSSRNIIDETLLKHSSLSEYCTNTAGLVTGANDFFILSSSEVDRLRLREYSVPIIKRGAQVAHYPEISDDEIALIEDQQTSLLDFHAALNSPLTEAAASYVKSGEDRRIHQGYKLKNRTPWYIVPRYKSAKMIFFKRAHMVPKLMINRSMAAVTDAGYVVNPKEGITATSLLMSFYSTLGLLSAELEGRFYGGGVLELTPNEFRSVRVPYVEADASAYMDFKDAWAGGGVQKAIDTSDERLIRAGLFTEEVVGQLKSSLAALRAHRLRHSGRLNSSTSELKRGFPANLRLGSTQ